MWFKLDQSTAGFERESELISQTVAMSLSIDKKANAKQYRRLFGNEDREGSRSPLCSFTREKITYSNTHGRITEKISPSAVDSIWEKNSEKGK
ncbi:hypothetical protein [Parachitinimonas caeni]|uniref:Uncharacterized protein n=1 Tax=Parachitinimonas caeni TaxID=3031301 RepID=A0ABT7E500_9NEIS|nr:hypothetical protein [Parachitinimonas caeni]MDK2125997.1 hypothetical protein [Parachitinimonas caeni]